MLDRRFQLSGDHFLINIALPENNAGGLSVVERDPRKQEAKPDCYVGVVEAVGPLCEFVKVGDKIVLERWEYTQYDIDDERLVAREIDGLIFAGEKPAPNVIAFQVVDSLRQKYSELILPDVIDTEPERYFFGKVTGSACKDIAVGDFVWVMKTDENQYRLGDHTVVCRLMEDEAIMKGVLVPMLQVA